MSIDLTVPTQNNVKNRIDFRIDDFRKMLQQKGMRMSWQQSADCPCTTKSTTDLGLDLRNVNDIDVSKLGSRSDCGLCGGRGTFFHSNIEIRAIVTENKALETVEPFGVLQQGDVKITLEPEHLPTYGDHFTLLDSVIIKRETFEIKRVNGLLTNIKLSSPVINRSMTLNAGVISYGILNMVVADANGNVTDTTDRKDLITVNADGTINLQNNINIFADGLRASITYYTNPVYVVNGYPHTIRDTRVLKNAVDTPSPMPVQCSGRLKTALERDKR